MVEVNPRFGVVWYGVEEASNALRTVGINSTQHLAPELRRIIKPYRTPIRNEAPKGPTGNLRKGIKWKVSGKGIEVASTAPHTHLVYGAIGRGGKDNPYGPPNPYLHRAVGRHRVELHEGIAKVIEDWFEKAAAVTRTR